MRKLNFDDSFAFSEIMDRLDINADLNHLFDEAQKHPDKASFLGGQFVLLVFKRWHKAKDEIKAFVAGITEQSVEDVSKMGIGEIKSIFLDLFKNEDFKDFFNMGVGEQK